VQHVKYDLGQQKAGAVAAVTLRQQANVQLMDLSNYRTYQRGGRYQYIGGLAKASPVRLQIPRDGQWVVVIDLGGRAGRVNAGVVVEPPPRGSLPTMQQHSPADTLRRIRQQDPELPAPGELGGRTWDVFVSHAHEDKESIARPLARALEERGVSVWLDELELKIGDSLRRRIDHGIRSSRFGLVILSEAFFLKGWTQYELDGLVTLTVSGKQTLLPIWHDIDREDVARQSPSLADKVALSTGTNSIEEMARQIAEVVQEAAA
jgi:hypothetical protein